MRERRRVDHVSDMIEDLSVTVGQLEQDRLSISINRELVEQLLPHRASYSQRAHLLTICEVLMMLNRSCLLLSIFMASIVASRIVGTDFVQAEDAPRVKRILLIGQRPDGHPFGAHEYMSAAHVLAKTLQAAEGVQVIITKADGEWKEGPELLDGADGAVLFVSEGARWLRDDPERLKAFQKLAERGGGLSVLHWGMGTQDAKNIADFVDLFGGCHGGPDRKYKVVDVDVALGEKSHPILRGIKPFQVHEEFYYGLKVPAAGPNVTPLFRVPIDGDIHTVAWAWERKDGGRSFGFSGFHFHDNWKLPEYRRLATQAALWTVKLPIPAEGLDVNIEPQDLVVPPRPEEK